MTHLPEVLAGSLEPFIRLPNMRPHENHGTQRPQVNAPSISAPPQQSPQQIPTFGAGKADDFTRFSQFIKGSTDRPIITIAAARLLAAHDWSKLERQRAEKLRDARLALLRKT